MLKKWIKKPRNTIGAQDICSLNEHDKKNCRNEDRDLFNFGMYYHKLNWKKFTTIRSVNYATEHEIQIGDIGWITQNRNRIRKVKVANWIDMKICDMPIELLKRDVLPVEISTHQEFVDGLNQILLKCGQKYANNRITTIKRIFFLEAI